MTIRVAQLPGVFLQNAIEPGAEVYVVQVGREHALTIVIVDLALVEHRVANPQIEEAGVTAVGAAALDHRDVGHAVGVGKDLHHRAVDDETIQIPLLMEDRNNAHAHLGVCHLQQRRIRIRSRAVNRQTVEVQAEVR